MPCISGTFDPKVGILLDVNVSTSVNEHTGTPKQASVKGVADTGASKT